MPGEEGLEVHQGEGVRGLVEDLGGYFEFAEVDWDVGWEG